jgi:hypothetical protein
MLPPGAINPYAAPSADIQAVRVTAEGAFARALYTPRQILAATLFGSLFAGTFLLWFNTRAMASPRRARLALALGLLASGLVAIVGAAGRPGVDRVLHLVTGLQFFGFCNAVQGPAVYHHLAIGGRRASNWMVFVAALLAIVFTAIVSAVLSVALGGPTIGLG